MSSTSDHAFVWVWLPGAAEPVPAGRLQRRGTTGLWFEYGRRYLTRADAVSLSPTLPLGDQAFGPTDDLGMPGALRDASPDAWGRRVLLEQLRSPHDLSADTDLLDELSYLLESGSNRFGAIDFQRSTSAHTPRTNSASLDELHEASQMLDAGQELPRALAAALVHGTSIGGARPKAAIIHRGTEFIAKFSASSDPFPVVGAEAASLALARATGIDAPESQLINSLNRDVLLIQRFDRPGGGRRLLTVSGLTLLGLGEMTARHGTYPELLARLREHGHDAGPELFRRIAFNVAISNTDDHLRNHAAFWDGHRLRLTPAYDLSPMARSGHTAYQALAYGNHGERESNFASLRDQCHVYGLSRREAIDEINTMIDTLHESWPEAADAARLTSANRRLLWGRQFLNPGTLHGWPA